MYPAFAAGKNKKQKKNEKDNLVFYNIYNTNYI